MDSFHGNTPNIPVVFLLFWNNNEKKSLQSLHDLALNYLRPPCPLSVPSLPYSFLTSTLSFLLLFVGAKHSPLNPFTRI